MSRQYKLARSTHFTTNRGTVGVGGAAFVGALALVVVAASAGATAWLFAGDEPIAFPGSRPDGRLAFMAPGHASGPGVDNREIYLAEPDGEDVRNVTGTLASERDFAWSADGGKVAFLATSLKQENRADSINDGLYVMAADGTGLTEILPCPTAPCKIQDLAWSPDGSRIAFIQHHYPERRSSLVVLAVGGSGRWELCGQTQQCGPGIAAPVWSPDGTRIAFSNEDVAYFRRGIGIHAAPLSSAIFVANPGSETVSRITNFHCRLGMEQPGCGFDGAPAWSPDGKEIAFVHIDALAGPGSGWTVDRVRIGGSDRTTLSSCLDEGCFGFPRPLWSPDGRSLAFLGHMERPVITVVPAGGGWVREVRTCTGGRCVMPSLLTWSPSGNWFAFRADYGVHVIGTDGNGLRKVIDGLDECCLAWLPALDREASSPGSPVGSFAKPPPVGEPPPDLPGMIAFVSDRTSPYNEDANEIYTMQADGTKVKRLTELTEYNSGPSWSPDGSRIVFAGEAREHDGEVLLMNSEGRGLVALSSFRFGAGNPDWSPDGSLIAFTSQADSGHPNIFVVRPDGTGLRQLTHTEWGVFAFTWSPDGSSILFEGDGESEETNLYLVKVASGDTSHVVTLPWWVDQLAWSPDGSTIAFVWDTPGGRGIHLMDPDGTDIRRLRGIPEGGSPTWSPDGSWLLFGGAGPTGTQLYVVRPDGTGLARLGAGEGNDWDPDWVATP